MAEFETRPLSVLSISTQIGMMILVSQQSSAVYVNCVYLQPVLVTLLPQQNTPEEAVSVRRVDFGSGSKGFVVEKPWWQKCEVDAHIVSRIRKQSVKCPLRIMCLNTWLLARGIVFGGCETFGV